MRITIYIVLFWAAYQLHSQAFNANYSNKPLNKVLKEVIKEYDLKISYSPSLLKEHAVTKSIRANSAREFITSLLSDLPFEVRQV